MPWYNRTFGGRLASIVSISNIREHRKLGSTSEVLDSTTIILTPIDNHRLRYQQYGIYLRCGVNTKGNLTGFTTNTQLANWLQSGAVAPFTDELTRDYLAANPDGSQEEREFINHLTYVMETMDDP
ncbi:hypothetical protein DL771_005800 [Monosporascus sp. 5C6A]|nr:hypothetical protein DL771_005800 [Monosporascus sp. 5C6A]